MSKSTKIIATLGVVAGLGVAALPMSAFALDPTGSSPQTTDVDVKVNIGSAISITATNDPSNSTVTMTPSDIDTSTLKTEITVSTNDTDGYTLTVTDKDANTNLVNGSATIPTGTSISAGTAAWAIKGGLLTNWTAMVPNTETPLTVAQNSTNVSNEISNMTYGFSTAANQASGLYQDTITYTATVK